MAYYDDVPPCSMTILNQNGQLEERFDFHQAEITLGRVLDNDLVLYDPAVSRRHLVVYYRNKQFVVEDLGSANGSMLNQQMINQPMVLNEGDFIEVGSVRFRFSSPALEDDVPTEIGVGQHLMPTQEPSPRWTGQPHGGSSDFMVRARKEGGQMPLPPEGDTRTFSAQHLRQHTERETQLKVQQPQGVAHAATPAPGQQPQANPFALAPGQPAQQQGAVPGHGQPYQSGLFSSSAQQAIGSPAPSVDMPYQGAPPPGTPVAPRHTPRRLDTRKEARLMQKERNRVRNMTLWSGVLLAAAIVLLIWPFSKKSNKSKPIELTTQSYNNTYGYNENDRAHPQSVQFSFRAKAARVIFSFQLFSPQPLTLTLNDQNIATVPASPKDWTYHRYTLPRDALKVNQENIFLLQRVGAKPESKDLWGVTNVKLLQQIYPDADLKRAKTLYKRAISYFAERNSRKKPASLYWALRSFIRSQNYVALQQPPHPLYKEAAIMIKRIEQELDEKFQTALKRAKGASRTNAKRIYRRTMRHFPDSADPRYRELKRLLQ